MARMTNSRVEQGRTSRVLAESAEKGGMGLTLWEYVGLGMPREIYKEKSKRFEMNCLP